MVRRKIVWDKPALQALQAAYDYIKKDSLQNAELVRLDLLDMTQRLEFHSERHPPDKFKTNNDGTYRAFEKHSYRITYKNCTSTSHHFEGSTCKARTVTVLS